MANNYIKENKATLEEFWISEADDSYIFPQNIIDALPEIQVVSMAQNQCSSPHVHLCLPVYK